MISISKRRLVSLASASALVATMAVASVPAATFAAEGNVVVNGQALTVMYFNPTTPVTGPIDASEFDIAVYYGPGKTGTVANANISGAKWYGVVADGAKVNVTGSKVHDIGAVPFDGVQRGRVITYLNGASGTISGNQVYNFQKNGIEVINLATTDFSALTGSKTSATIEKNVITGRGSISYIAQNGIVIRDGGKASVKNNTITKFDYTPESNNAAGILLWKNELGTFAASANKFAGNEVNIYTTVTEGAINAPGGHFKP